MKEAGFELGNGFYTRPGAEGASGQVSPISDTAEKPQGPSSGIQGKTFLFTGGLRDFTREELIGQNHNIVRHPDMPKTIFKLLWDTVQQGNEIFAYVKNLRKDGGFYWVYAQVTPTFNSQGDIVGYHSVRRKPNKKSLQKIKELYKKILDAERDGGIEGGVKFLNDYLKSLGVEYDEYIFTI